jgi:hypothetical protein
MNPTKTGVDLRCSWRGKKSLKIPKELSESVNRRTDNTMAKRKRTNSHLHNTTQKTKDPAMNGVIILNHEFCTYRRRKFYGHPS